jgi:hypothetical protein
MRKFLKIKIPVPDGLEIPRMDGRESIFSIEPGSTEARSLAKIATSTWKAKTRLERASLAMIQGDMKRLAGDIDRIWQALMEMGIEIDDHKDKAFDYGSLLKVVTTQPMPGITKEKVIETFKPTVYWQKKIIQIGEVEIATPIRPQEKP